MVSSHPNSGKPEIISAKPQNEQGDWVRHSNCGHTSRESVGELAPQSPLPAETRARPCSTVKYRWQFLAKAELLPHFYSLFQLSLLLNTHYSPREQQDANLHTNKPLIPSHFSSLKCNVISTKKLLNSFVLTFTLHCFLLYQVGFFTSLKTN